MNLVGLRSSKKRHVGRHASLGLGLVALLLAGCDDGTTGQAVDQTTTVDMNVSADQSGDGNVTIDVVVADNGIGEACTDASECGEICATLLPDGYCTESCDTGACPEGSACKELNGFPFCFKSCASDADCRTNDGYSCLENVCNIACKTNFDCDNAQECKQGVCSDPTPDRLAGTPCTSSKQCVSGACLAQVDGGVCAAPCLAGDACEDDDWSCRGLITVDGTDVQPLCAPGGAFASDEVELTVTQNPITFTVGSDVVSFMLIAEGAVPDAFMGYENLRRPDGSLAAGALSQGGFTAPYRMSPNQGHASLIYPNNSDPALQPVPGEWQVDILTNGPLKRVRALFKRRASTGGDILSGVFDMNIYIAPGVLGNGVNAGNAAQNGHLQSALNQMRQTYWGPHNLSLGTIRYFDLPSQYANVADEEELHQMFASESVPSAPGGLNIFLVSDLLGGQAAGIAGGIPGPVGAQGTGGSGVAVQVQRFPVATGDNMTHELGHFIGFYHVTEVFGNPHDIIADTDQCNQQPARARNYEPCMDNIMFPILLSGTGVDQEISTQQGRIGRLNPNAK